MKPLPDTTTRPQPVAGPRVSLPAADAYLFDIDGTLLNVSDATHYFAFLNAMREVFGVECNLDGVPVHGNTDTGILRAALRLQGVFDEQFEAGIDRAITQMCAEVVRNAADLRPQLCAAAAELLRFLRDQRKLLGIVTGNLDAIGWAKLEKAGLRDFFQFGCFCASSSGAAGRRFELRADILRQGIAEVRRRLGPGATVCFVGDTPSDVTAARALQVPVIAVATGIYPLEQLAACSPDVCVSCLQDFL